ncbi:transposase [Pontibacter korlensis]|uniref:Transposase IS4-like domain-containing protein n=1 Tax=Pontibacter korlensis TaxID=400092 RepID=A0A0E3ZID7_9BACT|nr:transposase [Pontibacter korlensis]AKD05333.1 hypothetical protein PKOR_22595 [Pontibacter korlensis]
MAIRELAVTDTECMLLHVVTTEASVKEIANLEDVLGEVEMSEHIPFYADKGYVSEKNRKLVKGKKLKDRIQKKTVQGRH